jgi:hypothetical protein
MDEESILNLGVCKMPSLTLLDRYRQSVDNEFELNTDNEFELNTEDIKENIKANIKAKIEVTFNTILYIGLKVINLFENSLEYSETQKTLHL